MRNFTSLILVALCLSASLAHVGAAKAVYAVNCGGPKHFDSVMKVTYQQDRGFSDGVQSDFGMSLAKFPRVQDDTVYRTERYHDRSFTYQIPVRNEGPHTLVLKFSEVYFDHRGAKVFDVVIGGLTVVRNLDIFSLVGKGVPHDEYVELNKEGDALSVEGTEITKGWDPKTQMLTVEFVKGKADNPKINAIVLYEGTYTSRLPTIPSAEQRRASEIRDFESEEEEEDVGDYTSTLETETNAYKIEGTEEEDIWKEESGGLAAFMTTTPGLVGAGVVLVGVAILAMQFFKGSSPRPAEAKSGKKK